MAYFIVVARDRHGLEQRQAESNVRLFVAFLGADRCTSILAKAKYRFCDMMGLHELCQKCQDLMKARLSLADIVGGHDEFTNREVFFFLERRNSGSSVSDLEAQAQEWIPRQGLKVPQDVCLMPRVKDICFHHEPKGLVISATSGCHLCNLIAGNLHRLARDSSHESHRAANTLDGYIYLPLLSSFYLDQSVANSLRYQSRNITEEDLFQSLSEYPLRYVKLSFLLLNIGRRAASLGSSIYVTPFGDQVQPTHGSSGRDSRTETIRRIRTWITECQVSHKTCQRRMLEPNANAMPSRLLELDTTRNPIGVRLRKCKEIALQSDVMVKYACLSHKWGLNPIQCRLKLTNYTDYLQDIVLDNLPATFKDAISLTIQLGLQYLWIDALCIIQDSTEDWEAEAPRMALIYANCQFNLAACGADRPDDGLVLQNNLMTTCFPSSHWFDGDNVTRIGFSAYKDCEHELTESALYKRAWTFQERHLPSRVVHFLSSQVVWDCLEYMGCEIAFQDGNQDGSPWRRLMSISHNWELIIREYSAGELTKRKDRLIAIAGMAQAYAYSNLDLQDSDYVAGLWRPTLKTGLLWRAAGPERQDADSTTATRYIAPSWSWASLNRLIFIPSPDMFIALHPKYHIKDVSLETVGANPYSSVVSGHLSLVSHLLTYTYKFIKDENESLEKWTMKVSNSLHFNGVRGRKKGDRTFAVLVPDRPKDFPDRNVIEGIMCPLDYEQYRDKANRMFGFLALRRVAGKKGVYKRIGIFNISHFSDDKSPQLPPWESLWDHSSPGIGEEDYIEKHGDEAYEICII